MRIRNRPTPSIFPPPPDLNLNRRSINIPSPSPPKQKVQDHDDTTTTTPADHLRSAENVTLDPSSDQPDAALARRSVKMVSTAAKPASAAATITSSNNDNDADSNNSSSWKDENLEEEHGTGMHPFSHNKGIVNKGEAVKRGPRMGAVSMEGSRCSRVNGRGWRCGQQTLVGYSLCEHHLGKSRLRSLSSVKNVTTSNKDNFSVALSNCKKKGLVEAESDDDDNDDDDEPLLISSGRKKSRIGTVKARSLSSLLGQTSQTTNNLGVSQRAYAHKRNAGK